MSDPSSPILDLFPRQFKVDQPISSSVTVTQDWKKIILLPFIDEDRLKRAVIEIEKDPEILSKNSFGKILFIVDESLLLDKKKKKNNKSLQDHIEENSIDENLNEILGIPGTLTKMKDVNNSEYTTPFKSSETFNSPKIVQNQEYPSLKNLRTKTYIYTLPELTSYKTELMEGVVLGDDVAVEPNALESGFDFSCEFDFEKQQKYNHQTFKRPGSFENHIEDQKQEKTSTDMGTTETLASSQMNGIKEYFMLKQKIYDLEMTLKAKDKEILVWKEKFQNERKLRLDLQETRQL